MSGRLLMRSSLPRVSRCTFAFSKLSQFAAREQPFQAAFTSRPFSQSRSAAFSVSSKCFESEGQVNAELSAKLESELSMEKEMRDTTSLPDHLREYLDNSPFQLEDTPRKEDVVLTRSFGDEKIRVSFSIDDLNNVDEDADQLQEQAFGDDFEDSAGLSSEEKGNVNQGPPGSNVRTAPEDSIASADREGEDMDSEAEQEPSFPAHVSVTVERPGKGALEIQTIAQDGVMVIDNVHYFKNAKYLSPSTSEDDRAIASLYTGPPFSNLDEDLQVLFERFLDERGINTTMALFIPEYIDFKEQNEYLNWLSNIKNFVE